MIRSRQSRNSSKSLEFDAIFVMSREYVRMPLAQVCLNVVTRKGTNHMGDQSCIEDIEVRHRLFKFCGRSAPLAGRRSCPGPSLECPPPPPASGGGAVARFLWRDGGAPRPPPKTFPPGSCTPT